MPYATNREVRIYYESEGDGLPVVMLHGALQSLESWRVAGYTEAMRASHQLVLVDARGHGRSDKPHDLNAYFADLMAEDVIAVLDQMRIAEAAFVGFSLGGDVGYRVAAKWPHRLTALAIGGAHPFGNETSDVMLRRLKAQGIGALLEGREALDAREREIIASNDAEALIACLQGQAASASVAGSLSTLVCPTLLYVGASDRRADQMRQAAAILPNAELRILPDVDHVGAFYRSELVIPIVRDFLNSISEDSPTTAS